MTRECFFCGSMLIDMVDNDIEVKDEDFANEDEEVIEPVEAKKSKLHSKLIQDEWEI